MKESLLYLVAGIAIGFVFAWLYAQLWKARYTRTVRRDAVRRSEAVTTGKVVEQLVPYLPDFPFNPRDARFLGSPVDLVVFDGLSGGDVRRVVFVEVKTGGAQLTARERRVRDAVEAGRVAFVEHRAGIPLDAPLDRNRG
jgi:predicted Holliday junction resolvase-like endonuclease